jgi:Major Facilitator Superfamily
LFDCVGGIIADVFTAEERGFAMNLFAGAPFIGPSLGPIIGGFLGENAGWIWVEGLLAIFTGLIWMAEGLVIPETYGPVLLRKRAARLSKITGKVYVSKLDHETPKVKTTEAFTTALGRPWVLLFAEPIVLLLSIYMAIVYGTLYLLFGAFPIIYEQHRGWSEGVASLPFTSVLVGMLIGLGYNMWDNKRYLRISKQFHGFAPPEERLPPAMLGGIAIPIGLFWFAWTNSNSLPWIVSVIAAAPFGFGMVMVFQTILSYLIDAYTIFAASALAANSIIRSVFGAVFPLFTAYMYSNLGIHWASCVPAFLALACVPFPFLFYKYGAAIRQRCRFAAEADAFVKTLERKAVSKDANRAAQEEAMLEQARETATFEDQASIMSRISTETSITTTDTGEEIPTLERVGTYQANPYDIDRVNTRRSSVISRPRSVRSLSKKT